MIKIHLNKKATHIIKDTTDVFFLIDTVSGLEKKYVEEELITLLECVCEFASDLLLFNMRGISTLPLMNGGNQ